MQIDPPNSSQPPIMPYEPANQRHIDWGQLLFRVLVCIVLIPMGTALIVSAFQPPMDFRVIAFGAGMILIAAAFLWLSITQARETNALARNVPEAQCEIKIQTEPQAPLDPVTTPPWLHTEAFPLRPASDDYGYMAWKKMKPCTRQELFTHCSRDEVPPVHLVWTPENPRLVPPAEVPFLSEAVKARTKHACRTQIITGTLNGFSFGILPLIAMNAQGAVRRFVILNFLLLGVLPVSSAVIHLRKLKTLTSEQIAKERTLRQYEVWVATRKINLTWVLAGCILAIFIAQLCVGLPNSVENAGLVKAMVWKGQAWRLLTGPMLHGGGFHLLFNIVALFSLGRLTEVLADRAYLATVFLASMLAGSFFSLFLLPHTTSVGASGGLMGLIGFFAIVGHRRKEILPPGFLRSIAISVLLVTAMGIVAYDIIDNAAHLGGFLSGLLLGFLMIRPQGNLPLTPTPATRRLGTICTTILIAMTGATLYTVLHKSI